MVLEVGMRASVSRRVTQDDTALACGTGVVPVLSTPMLLRWCEQATCEVLAGHLDPGQTSVGMRITLDHVAPSPVGVDVTALAQVERIDGRRVTFAVSATNSNGTVVCEGRVVRVLVNEARFLERIAEFPEGEPAEPGVPEGEPAS